MSSTLFPKVTTLNLYQKLNDNHLILSAGENQGVLNYKNTTNESLPIQISNLYVVSSDELHSFEDVALELYNIKESILSEEERAIGREDTIQEALTAEISRATARENEIETDLTAALDTERTRINNILDNTDEVALNSLREIVDEFKDADENLNNAITSLTDGLDGRLEIVENLLKGLFGTDNLGDL